MSRWSSFCPSPGENYRPLSLSLSHRGERERCCKHWVQGPLPRRRSRPSPTGWERVGRGGERSIRLVSRRFERVLAFLPVAGAELVGLQGVEDAQDFLRVPADAQVVDRGEADDALGIDDEGCAQGDAFLLV